MRTQRRRTTAWRRALRGALVGVLLGLLLLTGCATFGAAAGLSGTLAQDGFTNPTVGFQTSTGAPDTVTVTASGHASLPPGAATQRAAQLVWTRFPRQVGEVDIEVAGTSRSFDGAELTATFGPRDPALDATTVGDDAQSTIRTVGIVVAVVGLLFVAGIVVLVVVLRRRARRRAAAPPPPPPGPRYGQGPPFPGWPSGPTGSGAGPDDVFRRR